jgi:hypothetical protein
LLRSGSDGDNQDPGQRLFNTFDVVAEYVEAIDHWSKMNNSSTSSSSSSSSSPVTNGNNFKKEEMKYENMKIHHIKTFNEYVLLHRVLTFFHYCSNISDDRLQIPTKLVLPSFHRDLPPNVDEVIELMKKLLPLSTSQSISSMYQSTTPNISIRSLGRMNRMNVSSSSSSSGHNQHHISNFNSMGIYWLTRYQWVQFPIFIMYTIIEYQSNMKHLYDEIITNQKKLEEDIKKPSVSRRSSKNATNNSSNRNKDTVAMIASPMKKKIKKDRNRKKLIREYSKSDSTNDSILITAPKVKLGDDPFELLHTMINKSSGSVDSKIFSIRSSIMKQKRILNGLIVKRRNLDKKNIIISNYYQQCKEIVKETEEEMSKLKISSCSDGTNQRTTAAASGKNTNNLTQILKKVLIEHYQKLYFTQILMICKKCKLIKSYFEI